jgi:hypothetical protein
MGLGWWAEVPQEKERHGVVGKGVEDQGEMRERLQKVGDILEIEEVVVVPIELVSVGKVIEKGGYSLVRKRWLMGRW